MVSCLGAVFHSRADPLDNWHTRSSPASSTGNLAAVTYGSGLFVAVGGSDSPVQRELILTSPDALTWTARSSGNTNPLTAVGYCNGTFVALGTLHSGGLLPDSATIVTSSNGTDWINSALFPSNTLRAVTYGNGVFVTVGDRVIFTSSNGVNWSSQNLPGQPVYLRYVVFGNGLFVAEDGNGYTVTSPDGYTWVNRRNAPEPLAMTYGNGVFVVISGEFNNPSVRWVSSSADAENWALRGYPGVATLGEGLTYGNGTFVLLGIGGSIAYTSDLNLAIWNQRALGNFSLRDVTYGRGTFVIVGDQGVILQSDPLPTARLMAGPLSDQGLPLTISGEAGLSYRLQASTDLPAANWTDLLTFTNTAPATNCIDSDATHFSRRFYRVVSP
jgi:hypothetical protein